VNVRFARWPEGTEAALRELPGVASVVADETGNGAYAVSMRPGQDARENIAALAVGRGWGLLEMRPITQSLEDTYIDIISGKKGGAAAAGSEAASAAAVGNGGSPA